MKKLLITVLAMFFMVMPAFGEEIDLEAMSLDELQALHERINSEISRRTQYLEKSFSGLLIGGTSINPGTYLFTCAGTVKVSVWVSDPSYYSNEDPQSTFDCSDGNSFVVGFDRETYVLIEGGTVYIEPVTEDWVPKKEE